MDLLLIAPGNANGIYQDLSNSYAAIEPPTWALLLAQSVRSIGFKVAIMDVNAERLTDEQALERIIELKPRLICFVVYGQNVNAGTVNMSGATHLSKLIKEKNIKIPVAYLGSYVQALPIKALKDEDSIDFAFTNEGVYALHNVLKLNQINDSELINIKGIVRSGRFYVHNFVHLLKRTSPCRQSPSRNYGPISRSILMT
jgi:hypothetical protein